MFSNGFLLFIITLFSVQFSTINQAQAQSPDNGDIFMMCRRDKSVRWLRAAKLENGKCKTFYSKEGYMQVISSATFFASCEGVLQSVRKNIEEGGFKCLPTPGVQVADIE